MDIRKTIPWAAPLDPTTASGSANFAEQMKGYADIGVVEVHLMQFHGPIGFIRGLGEHVVPAVGGL